ncbi:hypothetical protein EPI10_027567 [Gossypium australe]|uniref:Uncharacterized protein n=1 Tax=Gossypium australe TaxID=47621 RepID=A0A5B6UU13_9ROSI|nr:hypothetical protein EPI10_027567 [Gossypium australe]
MPCMLKNKGELQGRRSMLRELFKEGSSSSNNKGKKSWLEKIEKSIREGLPILRSSVGSDQTYNSELASSLDTLRRFATIRCENPTATTTSEYPGLGN